MNERTLVCHPDRLYAQRMRLVFEIERLGVQPEISGGGAELVALMSFALARGFGADHPLIALAERLHKANHIPLGPLTNFYEADLEDSEDAAKFEMAWQPPDPLTETLSLMVAALRDDQETRSLAQQAGAAALSGHCEELLPMLERAREAGARVRLGYHL